MTEQANLKYIDNLAGGDEEFRLQFIGILKNEFPEEKAEYEKSIAEDSYKTAHDIVHKVKHKINILGLEKSHDLAVRHEAELREGLCTLNEEFQKVLNYMATYLKTI